ncbi:WYL domain-containing protein [Fundidesulfovibrio butyratiphilus]
MRLQQIAKILQGLDFLNRPQGATLKELAQGLGVSERQVYRILDIMQGMGFPIYDEQPPLQRAKRWRIEEGYAKRLPNLSLPRPDLTMREMIALYLAGSDPGPLRGSAIEDALASAFAKFEAFLPPGVLSRLERFRSLFLFSDGFEKSLEGKEALVESLTRAMLAQRTCLVTYAAFSTGACKTYRIDPLHFFEKKGGLYIFVRTTAYGDIRVLAVERIQALEDTPDTFQYPEGFDPEVKLGQAFNLTFDDPVSARVRIAPDQAKYVLERRFFQKQEMHRLTDGGVEIVLTTSGRHDLKSWVLSLGTGAELLEPEDLREEIRRELHELARRYDKG